MDLRDVIAVTVLPLVLDDPEAFVEVRSADKAGVAARAAYRIADAMLEARQCRLQEWPCNGRGTSQDETEGQDQPRVAGSQGDADKAKCGARFEIKTEFPQVAWRKLSPWVCSCPVCRLVGSWGVR